MADEQWQAWFEEAWEFREEKLYPAHFGSQQQGIYVLDGELFTNVFRQQSYDPRWLTHGVFEFEPTEKRPSWAYVSSGLSNSWEVDRTDRNAPAGLGCEFVFQCPAQSRWALLLLQRMVAFQILLAAGRFPGRSLLGIWDRVPLRSPIDGKNSQLTWVMLTPTTEYAGVQQLPTGQFQFTQFVGITEKEAEFARAGGSEELFRLLLQHKAAPITDPNRRSILVE
jgi:Suppressor of fused protein (SUFU)